MSLVFPCVVADDSRSHGIHTLGERARFVPMSLAHGVLRIGACPRCGESPEGTSARICTQTDCGLANRADPRILKGL